MGASEKEESRMVLEFGARATTRVELPSPDMGKDAGGTGVQFGSIQFEMATHLSNRTIKCTARFKSL